MIIFHKKYFLSENIELIKFEELKYNKSLPFVLGKEISLNFIID